VPRGRYRGRLKTALKELIDRHAQALSEEDLGAIADRGSVTARELKAQLQNDPDRYAETVTASIKSDLVRTIVARLVAKLEGALARARDAFEAMYNIEEELGERLIEAGREPIGSGLAAALVEDSFEELDRVLRDLADPEPVRRTIETYFDSFATADFFQELHELSSTLKIRENFETYLYIGELRFNRASYPLFYLSVSVELAERVFRIMADPPSTSTKRRSISRRRKLRGKRPLRTGCGSTSALSIWSRVRISRA
jgi:hypothetical protein